MKPQSLLLAEAADFPQRIDHACGGCAGRANHHERQKPFLAILGYAHLQIVNIHLEAAESVAITRRFLPSEARHVRNLVEAVMSFLGNIDSGLAAKMAQAMFTVFRERM